MGFIYKVTCLVNNKIYIGLTNVTVESRWRDHVYAAHTPSSLDYDFKFHRAIRKYGVENFNVETIENIRAEELQERERYWIAYYDSYNCGYNSTLGGDGQCKYNYDEIVEYYLTHNYNLSETCKNFGIYDQVVYSALKHSNIDYKSLPKSYSKKKVGKPILLVEKNIIFNSMKEIDDYFGKVVHPNIRRCLKGVTKKAYGFTWKEIDK